MKNSGRLVAAMVLALAAMAAAPAPPAERFETILRNGTIVDGSGLMPYRGDVAIAGGRIARLGNLSRHGANLDIDVTGLYVSPGFINIHSHPSPAALGRAENMLTQGVTTEILNADGSGGLDLRTQLSALATGGLAVNVGSYIGFNSIWSSVVGLSERRPSPDEIERMSRLIEEGLRAGAWGVSAGLDYKPAYFAQTAEVVRVLARAAPWRTNFTNHDRVTPETRFSSAAGIAETLEIARGAGLLGVVTHMKIAGREQGTARSVLDTMTDAGRSGHYTAADAYPYLAGMTAIGALIVPAWAQDGGRDALLKRLTDPTLRARIVLEAEQTLVDRFGGADVVYLPTLGKSLTTIMQETGVSAGEAIVRLLETSNPSAILRFGVEEDLRQILRHPDTSIACDCGATTATATHPRNYGAFPRVLGRYVREEKVLTWEDAVRKMTALPAATIGMVDRGYLATGMAADVTVFDPREVIDHATYENPAALSTGIRHVFVNGVIALRDGQTSGAKAGRVLSRGSGMPSRRMTANAERRVTSRVKNANVDVAIDVTQRAGERHARGRFRIELPHGLGKFSGNEFGVLQMGESWASFTVQAKRSPEGRVCPVTVMLDASDPLSPDGGSIIIEVEGARAYRGPLPKTSTTFLPGRRP